ncbi:MAG: glycerophosphodiester phosphodiesterase family protein [Calditrichota bacterium]
MKRLIGIALVILFVVLLILPYLKSHFSDRYYYVNFQNIEELQQYLSFTRNEIPLIGAHRGGPMPGYPENAIETFQHTLRYAPCLIECDVRKTKDDILIMMHDETLNRTTTGKGKVSDYTYAELEKLSLVDNEGRVTEFKIPSFAEVLRWGKNKAIIEVDSKNDVSPGDIVTALIRENALNYSVVITYTIDQLKTFSVLNQELVISASAHTVGGVQRILNTGIDPKRLVVFVGVTEPEPEVYKLLHAQGMRAILGTMHNIDNSAKIKGTKVYLEVLEQGADILATDDVPPAAKAIQEFLKMRRRGQ